MEKRSALKGLHSNCLCQFMGKVMSINIVFDLKFHFVNSKCTDLC